MGIFGELFEYKRPRERAMAMASAGGDTAVVDPVGGDFVTSETAEQRERRRYPRLKKLGAEVLGVALIGGLAAGGVNVIRNRNAETRERNSIEGFLSRHGVAIQAGPTEQPMQLVDIETKGTPTVLLRATDLIPGQKERASWSFNFSGDGSLPAEPDGPHLYIDTSDARGLRTGRSSFDTEQEIFHALIDGFVKTVPIKQ